MTRNRGIDLVILVALIAGVAFWLNRPTVAPRADLFQAIYKVDIPLAQEIIHTQPALIHKPNEHGSLPIHVAVGIGNRPLTQMLLNQGAGVNDRDANQLTPLHWAAKKGDAPMVEFLLDQGADPRAATPDGSTPSATAEHYKEGNWREVVRILALPHMKQSRAATTP